MRGILNSRPGTERQSGISPAHAGNTAIAFGGGAIREDQPRTCGEYFKNESTAFIARGSAPHMRGIPAMQSRAQAKNGISPAHAGNTRNGASCIAEIPDQPRTCGEYS